MTLLFILLAAIFNAAMDKVQHHYPKSVFSKWKWLKPEFADPKISWLNKYKDGVDSGPRFWGSTTILVFLTDFWHLLQFFFYKFIFLAVVFHNPNPKHWLLNFVDLIILHAIFTATKELFYSKIFQRK